MRIKSQGVLPIPVILTRQGNSDVLAEVAGLVVIRILFSVEGLEDLIVWPLVVGLGGNCILPCLECLADLPALVGLG